MLNPLFEPMWFRCGLDIAVVVPQLLAEPMFLPHVFEIDLSVDHDEAIPRHLLLLHMSLHLCDFDGRG